MLSGQKKRSNNNNVPSQIAINYDTMHESNITNNQTVRFTLNFNAMQLRYMLDIYS